MGDKSAYLQHAQSSVFSAFNNYSSSSSSSDNEFESLTAVSSKRQTIHWTLGLVYHSVSFMSQKNRSEMLKIMQKTRSLNSKSFI